MDTVEQANEEEVEALFTAPREGDALDESFAELDMDDETEARMRECNNLFFINIIK